VLPIFDIIRKYGLVPDAEMLRTFNMGIGLIVVTAPKDADKIIKHISKHGIVAKPIGKIAKGKGIVVCEGEFNWQDNN
jgi:phosphoribosylformylglycinamidine cyclo-ligase